MADKEQPEKILNKIISLGHIESGPQGLIPQLSIDAKVISYDNDTYTVKFLSSTEINGIRESSASISARHVGYAISEAKKQDITAVNGLFGSGESFIALLHVH